MPVHSCPGPSRKGPAVPEETTCPHCGDEIEVWSDQTTATCTSCGKEFEREQPAL
jgi:transcription elongation factor Elf1